MSLWKVERAVFLPSGGFPFSPLPARYTFERLICSQCMASPIRDRETAMQHYIDDVTWGS